MERHARIGSAWAPMSVALWMGVFGCWGGDPTWRLEEVRVRATEAEHVSVVADCRGANRLAWRWEVEGTTPLPEPAWISVTCRVSAERPTALDAFDAPERRLQPWRNADPCTPEVASRTGVEDCSTVAWVRQDEVDVVGPWCRLRFHFAEPSTGTSRIVTYCRRD